MPSEIYDNRLNNIKTWPNFYEVSYSNGTELAGDYKVSDNNYVICVKKPDTELEEKFFNGDIQLEQNNYIRRVSASSFMTTDNIMDDIWGDTSTTTQSGDEAPPPYIPNTYAIRRIVKDSVWNSVSTTESDQRYRYHNIASSGAVQDLLVSTVWNKDKYVTNFNKNTTYSYGDECLYDGSCYRYTSNTSSSGNWNSSKWTEIQAVNSTGYNLFVPNIRAIQNVIYDSSIWNKKLDNVTNYSSTRSYAVNDECIHDNKCYRCTTAITSGEAWNSSHWTNISFVNSKGSNLFVPTVGAIQDIIDTSSIGFWTHNTSSTKDKYVPTVGAIQGIISNTTDNGRIYPNDSSHIPTNAAVNSVLGNLYASGAVLYNGSTNTYYIGSDYINDDTHYLTPHQMYLLGYNRWWT